MVGLTKGTNVFAVLSLCVASLCSVVFAGCSSKEAQRTDTTMVTARPAPPKNTEPDYAKILPNFSFVFSSSGIKDSIPSDSFKMDTTHTMLFETRLQLRDGTMKSTRGVAVLEPQDFDTLRMLMVKGNFSKIDSTDIGSNCPRDEIRVFAMLPINSDSMVSLRYYTCAADYNLLLGQTRTTFREFNSWIDRMRKKYRPMNTE